MRVVHAERIDQPAADGRLHSLNIELAGLAIASAIVLCGVVLTWTAKIGAPDLTPAGGVIPLYAVKSAAELEPALTMFEAAPARESAARALFARMTAPGGLDRVGQLREVRTRTGHALLSRQDIVALKPRLAVRSIAQFSRRVAGSVAIFVAAFWLAHLFRRRRRRHDDPLLLPALMMLCGIGLMTMIALRDPIRDTVSAELFAAGAAAGVLVMVAVSEVDFEASRLRRAVLLPLGLACALAALLLAFGSGPGTSGVKVNLFGAQPVEAIRLLVVFALAAYFGRRMELLRELSEPPTAARPWLRYVRLPRWRDVRPVLAGMTLVLLFFFFQKDLGPALVLSCVFLGMLGMARGRPGLAALGLALLFAGFAAAYWTGMPATVRNRVMMWADPWNNGVPGGTHVAQGLWALSTGAVWGSGGGLGSPNAIPEGHTDFVLAAIGEELGWIGFAVVAGLYAFLCWRCLRIARRAPGDFTSFLAVGVVLVLSVQAIVIAGGLVGLIPLSGVVTPFLSYGRSSMLANCAAIGIVLSIARRQSRDRAHMRTPIRFVAAALGLAGAAILSRAAWIQVVRADDFAAASSLAEQADGGYRFEYNPRLLAAARSLERGSIYDRNGLPLATSRANEISAIGVTYANASGVAVDDCADDRVRCYPLGGLAFHLLGDWATQANWGARNSSYLERDSDARLKGFDDHAAVVEVVSPRSGERTQAVRRDLRDLLPLVRQRYRPRSAAVIAIRSRERDLHTTLDARFQARVAAALRDGIAAGRVARGAAVVLDAATGELLAAASYPWPTQGAAGRDVAGNQDDAAQWLDRARYGLYPPGSTFKLIVAAAALRTHEDRDRFVCRRLPDGRVGNYVRGMSRPVRDDLLDTVPHGEVDLDRGLAVSCNAYFAQLALAMGPRPLIDAASLFQISVARSSTPDGVRPHLAQTGYGQGEALVTPLKLARVSASIAAGGGIVPVRWEASAEDTAGPGTRFLSARDAERIARAMRAVVTSGTGRSLRSLPIAIAGKTGTAEIGGAAAHAWFTGFAPASGKGRRIAFAVLVENAGYGGRAAAPIAGAIVTAASELGLIK
ncbi:MAG TPA: FtsW/RodA/SpoVE family cell cycle protein [Vicinamibacterales bacterium]|nr:FtsW/RodA/SpoVE family cell cycle protein [Vicinamibacterales bacterium]